MGNQVKMLQILIDGQAELKKLIKQNSKDIKSNGKRIDRLGKDLAFLQDDAPTIEEFDELKDDVIKLKKRVFSN